MMIIFVFFGSNAFEPNIYLKCIFDEPLLKLFILRLPVIAKNNCNENVV